MLIDTSYFVQSNYIPNIQGSSDVNDAISAQVEVFIKLHEPDFLKTIFGETFYDEFIAGIEAGTDKYLTLKTKLIDIQLKESPIANFIFCRYVQNQMSFNENNPNPTFFNNQRFVQSWNEMVDLLKIFVHWFEQNEADYTITNTDYFDENKRLSLFTYVNIYGI